MENFNFREQLFSFFGGKRRVEFTRKGVEMNKFLGKFLEQ